ncbi:MAG: hypothetical protein JO355_01880 [Planctomycetaceae bacterium]|nr:hypothetical protein [Planctomycetaceae bacterium]
MKSRWRTPASKSSAIVRKFCGFLLVLLALSSPAMADHGHGPGPGWGGGGGGGHPGGGGGGGWGGGGWGGGGGGGGGAPEIDPGALSGAMTLLVSGTLILTDRFRRK